MVTVANVSNVPPGIWKLFVISGENTIESVTTFYDDYENEQNTNFYPLIDQLSYFMIIICKEQKNQ